MINEELGNEPAFASVGYGLSGDGYCQVGLTKREYFAAMAMQGMLASNSPQNGDFVNLADCAVIYADQLIKTLNK